MRASLVLLGAAVAIAVGLHADIAEAQALDPPAPQGPAPAPSPPNSQAAGNIEVGANTFGLGNSIFSSSMDCARVASVQQGLQKEANAYQRLGKGFGKIGDVLTLISGGAQIAQGNYAGAAQTASEAALDKIVCGMSTVAGCAAWSTGRTIGAFVKMFPAPFDPQGRSIGDFVTDKEYEFVGPYYERMLAYMNQPATVENLQGAYSAYQAEQADLARRQREAEGRNAQCKAKEDAKNAIDEAVAKAKASVGEKMMSTASDPTLPDEADSARTSANSVLQQGSSQIYSEQAAAMSRGANGSSSYGMSQLGGASMSGIPANSENCAAAKAQLAEYDKWLAQMEPIKNETPDHADAYEVGKQGRAINQQWYDANCH